MVRKIVLSFFTAMCVLTAGSMVREASAAAGGFEVCHKGQTITVGSPGSVAAHVRHGDHLGTCAPGGGGGDTCVQACNDAFAVCFESAFGDPGVIAFCNEQLTACLAGCGG